MLFRSLGSLVPALEHRRGLLAREAEHTESIPGRLLLRRGAPLGDDRLVKTKPRLLKWLVLGCIKADFNLQVNARSKALDESYNMSTIYLLGTFLCTSPNSTIQHICVTNYDDFSQMFKQHLHFFAIFLPNCAESSLNFAGILQIVQKILPPI